MQFGGFLSALLTLLWALCFGLLASLQFGRDLLCKYPKLLTFGRFTREGPTRKQVLAKVRSLAKEANCGNIGEKSLQE